MLDLDDVAEFDQDLAEAVRGNTRRYVSVGIAGFKLFLNKLLSKKFTNINLNCRRWFERSCIFYYLMKNIQAAKKQLVVAPPPVSL